MRMFNDLLSKTRNQRGDPDGRPPASELDLRHWMPAIFEETLISTIGRESPLAVLFVPSEQILGSVPARALILIETGVLFMEEGESVALDQKWGVRTRFYPYSQIAGVDLGYALLRGRFALYSAGGAPSFEIGFHWYDLNNFRAAACLIRERIAGADGRDRHAPGRPAGTPLARARNRPSLSPGRRAARRTP
ncbi:MAG TPA: hypothetical protein VFJ58_04510 [Armatimonadota bacterium]|nr:hypothetical protein [Armatimonadota bacterium]